MINTRRLLIRYFQEQDYLPLYEYLSNPDIYLFEPGEPVSLDKSKVLARQRAHGTEFWAVILKESQLMIGHLYFAQMDPLELHTWELGYIFNPAFHNQGFATEAASALIHYGFAHFGIHRVVAHCNPENIPSWKVLEKLGMRREAYFKKNIYFRTTPDGSPIWQDTYEYAILQEDTIAG